ncbi:response regulator transcription factor [Desulfosporosinus fructosivorans]
MRVLIIEDEERISAAIAHTLKQKNYEVDCVEDGNDGLMLAEKGIYDIIILDIMIPGKSGLELLKELRNRGITTPVLLLTALDSITDRVSGLDLGADDYLGKPFSMAELMARIRALSRRIQSVYISKELCLGNMSLDADSLSLNIDKEEIKLTYKEVQFMEMLMRRPGMVFTREQIIDKVWGYDNTVTDNNIEIYIHYLRKKICKASHVIATVRGIGYTLEAR